MARLQLYFIIIENTSSWHIWLAQNVESVNIYSNLSSFTCSTQVPSLTGAWFAFFRNRIISESNEDAIRIFLYVSSQQCCGWNQVGLKWNQWPLTYCNQTFPPTHPTSKRGQHQHRLHWWPPPGSFCCVNHTGIEAPEGYTHFPNSLFNDTQQHSLVNGVTEDLSFLLQHLICLLNSGKVSIITWPAHFSSRKDGFWTVTEYIENQKCQNEFLFQANNTEGYNITVAQHCCIQFSKFLDKSGHLPSASRLFDSNLHKLRH